MPPVTPRGLGTLSRLEFPAFRVSDGPIRTGDYEDLRGEEAPILALGGIPVVFLMPELSRSYGDIDLSFELSICPLAGTGSFEPVALKGEYFMAET
jgi:hypothetical protein